MISRETIERMFKDMRRKSGWKSNAPLLWGYFFKSLNRRGLEAAAEELAQAGYELVDISPRKSGDWWLHVEKVEVHTVDSLCKRNDELQGLAESYVSVEYDGMDVGPVQP